MLFHGDMSSGSGVAADQSIVPQSAFFGGLGGSWVSGSFGHQDVYGKGTSISPTGVGNGSNYSTNQWLFGGVAMVGATYFINPTWFVDLSYSYSKTGTTSSSWGGPWNDTLPSGSTRIGNNAGTSSGSVSTQVFSVSINAAF